MLKGQSREEEEGKKATANSLPVSQVNSNGRYQIDNHDDPNFDRKLDLVTAGAKPHIREHLLTKISKENCKIIVDYVLAFLTEVSPAETYRIDTIGKLKQLAAGMSSCSHSCSCSCDDDSGGDDNCADVDVIIAGTPVANHSSSITAIIAITCDFI